MHQRGLHITTNFHMIKCWIETRKGTPAATEVEGKKFPTITFDYLPKVHTDKLEWDAFFNLITKKGLAMIYEKDHEDGGPAMFFKFVPWENYVDELKTDQELEDKDFVA